MRPRYDSELSRIERIVIYCCDYSCIVVKCYFFVLLWKRKRKRGNAEDICYGLRVEVISLWVYAILIYVVGGFCFLPSVGLQVVTVGSLWAFSLFTVGVDNNRGPFMCLF